MDCKECPVMLQFDKLYGLFKYSLFALIVISIGKEALQAILNYMK